MSAVTIYMEGGGNSKETKAALRLGMDHFLSELKHAAWMRRWRWKTVCCGGRNKAFDAFENARATGTRGIVVLLVDSEGPVNASPRNHLITQDKWDLREVDEDHVHLMVQFMETWIVADPEALSNYYGQGFHVNALPVANDLEMVAKNTVADALNRATERTQKGRYRKIHHAADLLKRVDPEKVKERCSHCARLFDILGAAVATR